MYEYPEIYTAGRHGTVMSHVLTCSKARPYDGVQDIVHTVAHTVEGHSQKNLRDVRRNEMATYPKIIRAPTIVASVLQLQGNQTTGE